MEGKRVDENSFLSNEKAGSVGRIFMSILKQYLSRKYIPSAKNECRFWT
jgi:hypothetical protein